MSSKSMKPILPAGSAAARAVTLATAQWQTGQPAILAIRKPSSSASSISSSDGIQMVMEKPKRKRQRLDHLTADEKIQRRKLKNRMAAQSARDRKKMKMQDLEGEVVRTAEQNDDLANRNAYLEKRVRVLEAENKSLRQKLAAGSSFVADDHVVASSTVEESFLKLMSGLQEDVDESYEQDDEEWSDAAEDGVIFDNVHMMEDNETSRDGSQSDVSDDSGLLSLVDTTPTSTSPARSCNGSGSASGDESFESAVLISEPQQQDQDSAVGCAPQLAQTKSDAVAEEWCPSLRPHKSPESKPQVRSTVITSTSSHLRESECHPLNLSKVSSSHSSTSRSSQTRCSRQQQDQPPTMSSRMQQRLMSYLIPLCSLMIASANKDKTNSNSLNNQDYCWPTLSTPSRSTTKSRPAPKRLSSNSLLHSTPNWNSLLANAVASRKVPATRRVRLRPPDRL